MKPKPRFKVGDTFTYLKIDDPRLDIEKSMTEEGYYFGGERSSNDTDVIISYDKFVDEMNCYQIQVTHLNKNGDNCYYNMLECECEEWFKLDHSDLSDNLEKLSNLLKQINNEK